MADKSSYNDLAQHNPGQVIVFLLIIGGGILFTFIIAPPILEYIFTSFLNGSVTNNGREVYYNIDSGDLMKRTNYLLAWAVDIYKDTPQEARYWFNPALVLLIPSLLFGIGIAIIITLLLPGNTGFMRRKIEREIAVLIDRICLIKYGYQGDEERREIMDNLKSAGLAELRDYADLWNLQLEDIKALRKAIIWNDSIFLIKLFNLNDGLRIYMRSYFTAMHSNSVLGFVYIGAAILIIIIGLRGLKFIPSTQPSLVFFALGLEFSLLILYAFTLMYSRQEEETELDKNASSRSMLRLGDELGNAKETEQLLRLFINTGDKDKHI